MSTKENKMHEEPFKLTWRSTCNFQMAPLTSMVAFNGPCLVSVSSSRSIFGMSILYTILLLVDCLWQK